jgi:hypothetical protein
LHEQQRHHLDNAMSRMRTKMSMAAAVAKKSRPRTATTSIVLTMATARRLSLAVGNGRPTTAPHRPAMPSPAGQAHARGDKAAARGLRLLHGNPQRPAGTRRQGGTAFWRNAASWRRGRLRRPVRKAVFGGRRKEEKKRGCTTSASGIKRLSGWRSFLEKGSIFHVGIHG